MAIYYKVYQNKECFDGHSYIIPLDQLETTAEISIESVNNGEDELPCVFEPIEMSKEEFDNLPEFDGF